MMRQKLADVQVIILHETAHAYKVCVQGDDVSNAQWVPKSQCEFYATPNTVGGKKVGTLTLSEYMAIEKRLV